MLANQCMKQPIKNICTEKTIAVLNVISGRMAVWREPLPDDTRTGCEPAEE